MTTKKCSKCHLTKLVEEFSFRDSSKGSRRSQCKVCENAYKKKNRNKISKKEKLYRQNNRELINENYRKYYQSNIEKFRSYRSGHKKRRNLNDPAFRLRTNVSRVILRQLQLHGAKKSGSCLKYLEYSSEELRQYLEKQFEPWMNWNNYGAYKASAWIDNDPTTWTWSLDHIIPQALLPYTSMEEENFRKCWALSNLRPLSSKQNWLDGIHKTRH